MPTNQVPATVGNSIDQRACAILSISRTVNVLRFAKSLKFLPEAASQLLCQFLGPIRQSN